ncbi:MAG: exodeoxyribonuclease VII small subunit [Desulfobacterales bacterium]|jgi:exodeoxyribonuclease VII small subunit|nr:exodeoxyribonuclease VII small subunit [Desulfobacterales bacterium]MDP6806620.1 exodeoxyribonuclease VII small subunit [Desulfobacterales bacterium]|tara:strand:+ start:40637 stop:40870 length:234 start_codon:yes stop_codon:yes gene_type:complete
MAKQNFENAMQKLEEITKELEVGELPLEKALQRFEEGVKLSKFCSEKLEETEKRVTILLEGMDGDILEKPFLTGNNT